MQEQKNKEQFQNEISKDAKKVDQGNYKELEMSEEMSKEIMSIRKKHSTMKQAKYGFSMGGADKKGIK